MANNTSYDLKSIQMPRLTGTGLRLFDEALENVFSQKLLLGSLLESGGINAFRALEIEEPPTFLPLHPASEPLAEEGLNLSILDEIPASREVGQGFSFKGTRDYAAAYRSGKTTPEAVAARALEAVEASQAGDPPMNFFIASDPEDVMAQARESTRRIERGEALSLFDGVPVAVKDEVDMRPYPTTAGTSFLGKTPARADSSVAARMRAAGALLLGKANMYEIGINPLGFNPHHGAVGNPYNPAHNTGGSSSGPAAIVASGLCPVAIGADGGGSIRIPASFCGVVGLKPTFGRVSEYGAYPLCWSVAHLGPLAASAEDAALAYAVLAGPDPKDPHSLKQPAFKVETPGGLDNLTLGVYRPWFRHATAEVVSICEALVNKLAGCGARVREIEIPGLEAGRLAHAVTILSEIATSLEALYAEHRRDFAPGVRASLVLGRALTARDYILAQRVRTQMMANFTKVLEEVDVILSPATAVPPPVMSAEALAGDESDLSLVTEIMRFVIPGNLAGFPAIAFPAGYTENGLPVGMQALGRPWEEMRLLGLAAEAERIVERRRPVVFYDILG